VKRTTEKSNASRPPRAMKARRNIYAMLSVRRRSPAKSTNACNYAVMLPKHMIWKAITSVSKPAEKCSVARSTLVNCSVISEIASRAQ
jgi:hypothetical protein